MGPGGSTAVTAIVIDGKDLWIANVGDSRAVVCEMGAANQLTVDHEPHHERRRIEKRGGFVTTLPGNISSCLVSDAQIIFLDTLHYLKPLVYSHRNSCHKYTLCYEIN